MKYKYERVNTARLALITAASIGLSFTGLSPALADPAKDIQVAGRALGFLENAPSGKAVIAIVFDSSKPGSVAQKDALMGALGSGLSAGSLTLVGKPVDVGAIGSVSGVAALYGTTGVSQAALGAAGKAHKLVTISAEKSCAESGQCVMSVTTSPSVEITVNHAAATAVGASFKAAFRMMIHEI